MAKAVEASPRSCGRGQGLGAWPRPSGLMITLIIRAWGRSQGRGAWPRPWEGGQGRGGVAKAVGAWPRP